MVHLPNELMLMILSYLEKRDAKACRLASRKWTDLTIPFIFNRIWISARTRDIAAFHEWTSNPRLANAVTSIYYDAAWLPFEANEELYVRLLCYQISLRYQAMGDDRTIDLVLPELMELHKNMHFIHEPDNRHSRKSLRYWTKHPLVKMAYARFETDTRSAAVLVQTRTLMHIISQGLKRLPKLSSAHFSDNHATIDRNFIFWDHRCNNPTGPPHMRSLSVVNLYPFTRDEAHLLGGSYGCYWATSPVDHRENSAEFGIFLEAISVARAPIQHLNVCRDSRLGVDLFSPGLKDVAAKHFAPAKYIMVGIRL
ncbi:hypothetical protein MMC25_008294 [Agyrium rufum]|nr:hypothetical protein [Agyrium rufum]